jgi:hypothetical protein
MTIIGCRAGASQKTGFLQVDLDFDGGNILQVNLSPDEAVAIANELIKGASKAKKLHQLEIRKFKGRNKRR